MITQPPVQDGRTRVPAALVDGLGPFDDAAGRGWRRLSSSAVRLTRRARQREDHDARAREAHRRTLVSASLDLTTRLAIYELLEDRASLEISTPMLDLLVNLRLGIVDVIQMAYLDGLVDWQREDADELIEGRTRAERAADHSMVADKLLEERVTNIYAAEGDLCAHAEALWGGLLALIAENGYQPHHLIDESTLEKLGDKSTVDADPAADPAAETDALLRLRGTFNGFLEDLSTLKLDHLPAHRGAENLNAQRNIPSTAKGK